MKYLLTILLLAALACKKDDNPTPPEKFADPTASSCNCATVYANSNTPVTNYSFDASVPDSIGTVNVTLKAVKNQFPVFSIKPKTGKNTWSIYYDKCPTFSDNAIYYFEFQMADGRLIKGQQFQMWQ
jgi:hypothetical protein